MQLFRLVSVENLTEVLQILACDSTVDGKADLEGAFIRANIPSTMTENRSLASVLI